MCSTASIFYRITFNQNTSSNLRKKIFYFLKQEKKYLNNLNNFNLNVVNHSRKYGSASAIISTATIPGVLSKSQAKELSVRLTSDEREILITALQECQSLKTKAEYETDSRKNKPPESVPQPSRSDLMKVLTANAIPFIGFGFLDNFVMIIAGDSIEATLGAIVPMTTMAAAAFGNTISDILGIGSAYYVEQFAQKIGFEPPKLTPIQLDLPKSRLAANLGRVLGVTIGCIIGMFPLLIINVEKPEQKSEKGNDEK